MVGVNPLAVRSRTPGYVADSLADTSCRNLEPQNGPGILASRRLPYTAAFRVDRSSAHVGHLGSDRNMTPPGLVTKRSRDNPSLESRISYQQPGPGRESVPRGPGRNHIRFRGLRGQESAEGARLLFPIGGGGEVTQLLLLLLLPARLAACRPARSWRPGRRDISRKSEKGRNPKTRP